MRLLFCAFCYRGPTGQLRALGGARRNPDGRRVQHGGVAGDSAIAEAHQNRHQHLARDVCN